MSSLLSCNSEAKASELQDNREDMCFPPCIIYSFILFMLYTLFIFIHFYR